MKFNCGPTMAERHAAKIRRLEQWHIWFAWRPVRLANNVCAWLEPVERQAWFSCYGYVYWSYRAAPGKSESTK